MNRVMWIGAALLLAACGSEPTDDELAADAWDAISGYESWGQADPWTGIQPSGRAHGPRSAGLLPPASCPLSTPDLIHP